MKGGGWGRAALLLALSAVVGTLLGQLLGSLLPAGLLHDLLLRGVSVGLREPLKLDLAALQLVFGVTLSVNLMTVVGLLAAVALLVKLGR